MKRYIRASQQKGWWYLLKHGLGPGSLPRDVVVLEVQDHPTNRWKCYALLDRVLTTRELNEYEVKEESPEIVSATAVMAEKADPYDPVKHLRYQYSRLRKKLVPGDVIKIEKRYDGGRTPKWADGKTATVVRVNSMYSVTVIVDDYKPRKTQINPYDSYVIE